MRFGYSRYRHTKDLSFIQHAILKTLVYSDVFDFPLSPSEIHNFLISYRTYKSDVVANLSKEPLASKYISHSGEYYALVGREDLFEIRRQRERNARRMWPKAIRYGRIIASLPFVRMVAVTGSLAMNNVERDADIDYLIVTNHGRLFISNALVLAISRFFSLHGDFICPNYLLSENALAIENQNLFTAHEFARMIPISGFEVFQRMWRLNGWVSKYLPNAWRFDRPYRRKKPSYRRLKGIMEGIFRTPLGMLLDRIEMSRMRRKIERNRDLPSESAIDRDRCKVHIYKNCWNTMKAFEERLRNLEGN
ncbi:MAG: hypothetical protein ACE5OZ_12130 [Candidatus Heimdallarchaeota archaeon]